MGSFLGSINTENYSGDEINFLLRKSKRLHLEFPKATFKGKDIGQVLQRQTIQFKTSKLRQFEGYYLEQLTIKPVHLRGVFFTDRNLMDVVRSSSKSMLSLTLSSCFLLNESALRELSRMRNLHRLRIDRCQRITD